MAAVIYAPVFRGQILLGRDIPRLFIPDAAFLLESLRRRELPLWNPYLRLGQPFAATLYSQAFYPPHWVALLAGPQVGITVQHLLHVGIACGGTFWVCRRLGASRTASFMGAALVGLGRVMTVLCVQENVADAFAWAGFLTASALRLCRRPSLRAAAVLALFFGMSFLAGSPETLVWQSLLVVGVAARARARARGLLLGAVGLAWGAALAAVVAIPGLELAAHSLRRTGAAHALNWSMSWPELLSAFWPFADEPKGRFYSGEGQWFLISAFLGTITCLLALFGATKRRCAHVFVAGALWFGVLATGWRFPPGAWLLSHPPLSFFRYPVKYYPGAVFCVAVLAALGVDRLAALGARVQGSLRRTGAGLVIALFVLGAGLPLTRLSVFREYARLGFVWFVLHATMVPLVFFAVGNGRERPWRIRRLVAVLACLEVLSFQLLVPLGAWSVQERTSSAAPYFPPSFPGRLSVKLPSPDIDPFHEQSPIPPSRFLDVLMPNRFVELGLRGLEGYGAPEAEYDALWTQANDRDLYDLAGVSRYIRSDGPPFEDAKRIAELGDGAAVLYETTTAFPRAFVVHEAQRVTSDEEAAKSIKKGGAAARKTAFLAPGSGTMPALCSCEGSRAWVEEEGLRWMRIAVDACGQGLLILSEAYFPGWRAWVDGNPAPVERADIALRAIPVPKGRHLVLLTYEPTSFRVGLCVTAFASVALLVVLGRRRRHA
jgi:hypothetical protein